MANKQPLVRMFTRRHDVQVDREKMVDLLKNIQADLDLLEWDFEPLKAACLGAVSNALTNEKADGFDIPPIVDVWVAGQTGPVLIEMPDEVQGPAVIQFMQHAGQKYEAERVCFAFVDDEERINVFVLLPFGRCYKVQGRIEGMHFIRTAQETHGRAAR
jgi:hypothetical protein